MQAVQRIKREKRMDGGKEKEEVDDPHTSAAKQKRPLRIGAELLPAERPSCSCVAACIRHYFPRQGGNLNCAGAHHGTLTPPRIAPSRPFREKTEVSLYPASASSQAAAPHGCYSSPEVAHSLAGGPGVGSCVASQKRKDPQH